MRTCPPSGIAENRHSRPPPASGKHVVKVGALDLFTPLLLDISVFLLVVGVTGAAASSAGPLSQCSPPHRLRSPCSPLRC
jgi:hypothetical protein